MRYRALPNSLKAAFWGTFANFFQKGVMFLSIPVFTHLMNTSEIGLFNVFSALVAAVYVLATLNIAWDVVQNGILWSENDSNRYLSSMLGLVNLIGLLVVGIYLLSPDFWDRLLGLPRSLSLMLLGYVLIQPILDFWLAKQRAAFRYRSALAVCIGLALGTPLLGIWAVKSFAPTAEARVGSALVVLGAISLPLYILLIRRGGSLVVWRYWRYALLIAIPLVPYYLGRALINQFDRVVIGNSLGLTAAGVYGVAYSAGTIVYMLGLSINQVLLPWVYRQMRSGSLERLVGVYLLTGLVVGLGSLAAAAFAPQVLSLLGPAEYQAGSVVFGVVSVAAVGSFVGFMFTNVLLYFEEAGKISSVAIIAAVSNVVLNLILVPIFGFEAAAWVTLLSTLIMAFGTLYAAMGACRKRGIKWPFGRVKPLLLCVGLVGWCLVTLLFYGRPIMSLLYVLGSFLIAVFPAARLVRVVLSQGPEKSFKV